MKAMTIFFAITSLIFSFFYVQAMVRLGVTEAKYNNLKKEFDQLNQEESE